MSPTKGLVIQDLADLNIITDKAFATTFIFNLKGFFQYSSVDINKVLDDREFAQLKELRDILLKLMAENFQDYSTKIPINRQKKDKLIADIILLGKTIALNEVSEWLDNVYKKKDPEPQLDLTDTDTLIKFVT